MTGSDFEFVKLREKGHTLLQDHVAVMTQISPGNTLIIFTVFQRLALRQEAGIADQPDPK